MFRRQEFRMSTSFKSKNWSGYMGIHKTEQVEAIDSLVDLYRTTNFVPGFTLSIVQDDVSVLEKGYGKKNIADDLDVDTNTLFAIGSVSKSFTSLLVVKVLSEKFPELGEAVLNTPIMKLAPSLNFTLGDRYRTEATTFRDLLSHRSCVFNAGRILLFDVAPIEEFVYRTRYDKEACSHRTGYVYNNALYALARILVSEIAGKPHRTLMTELLTQLGMTSSIVADPEGSYENLPDMSRAYTRYEGQVLEFDRTHLRRLGVAGGAGDILSTATDMAKYTEFHLTGGRVGGEQIIPKEVLDWMYVVSASYPGLDFGATTGGFGYSLGLIMGFVEGQPRISHGGFWPPYESLFSLFPTYKNVSVGIFSSINGPGGTGTVPDTLSQELLHVLIMRVVHRDLEALNKLNNGIKLSEIQPKYSFINDFEMFPILKNSVEPSAHVLQARVSHEHKFQVEELIGMYGNSQDGVLNITLNADNVDNLNIIYGKWGIGTLIPHPNVTNLYDVEWTTTINYDFYAQGPAYPVPVFTVDFSKLDQLDMLMNGADPVSFFRDQTLDTLPIVPWSPDSCGPSN